MSEWLLMTGGLLCPVAAFALLLWLTHLEDTLPRDVRSRTRTPDPPPILAVRVRPATEWPAAPPTVDVPRQRSSPSVEGSPVGAR